MMRFVRGSSDSITRRNCGDVSRSNYKVLDCGEK